MENLKSIIATNLVELRKKHHWTQAELALKLNYSDKAISKWEHGDALPDIEILAQIAELYGVTLDYLTHIGTFEEKKQYVKVKEKKANKLIISLLSITLVWFIAMILFVFFQSQFPTGKMNWIVFVWSVPLSCIIGVIFNSIWGRTCNNFFILSIFVWSLLAAAYLTLVQYNMWLLFLLGIPAQVAIILWSQIKGK